MLRWQPRNKVCRHLLLLARAMGRFGKLRIKAMALIDYRRLERTPEGVGKTRRHHGVVCLN